jgi:hypothetical protein
VLCRSVEDVTSTALHMFVLHSYAGPPQLSNIRICRVEGGYARPTMPLSAYYSAEAMKPARM